MFKKRFGILLFSLLSISVFAKNRNPESNRYVYDLSYKAVGLGQVIRDIQWSGEEGVVTSTTDLSFLLIDFGGYQRSHLYREKASGKILTDNFERVSNGFSTVRMTAEFSKNGHHVEIDNNGEKSEFSNEKNKIIDFNTITLEISDYLQQGKTAFDFYMQTSDDVSHYFFEVKGKESIKTQFGYVETFKVVQTRKKDRIFEAWFAPSIDYQMIKFHYQRKILDINGELVEYSAIPPNSKKEG